MKNKRLRGFLEKQIKMFKKMSLLLISAFVLHTAAFAQEADKEAPLRMLFAPLNSASLWKMMVDPSVSSTNLDQLDIAANPGVFTTSGSRPQPDSVYFGVPPKSASSVISLGVVGTDIDRFLSTTAYQDTAYQNLFAHFGFDKDSFSAGVSRKFTNGNVTGLYYNGNIIEDILAYMANNSLTNGQVGFGIQENGIDNGTDFEFMGDLKNRNNINSRSNINLMFGLGALGVNVGYSQKLFGLVQKSNGEVVRDTTDPNKGILKNTQQGILDDALVPNIEFGLRFDKGVTSLRTTLGFQMDIHQHRELSTGQKITLDTVATTYTDEDSTKKLSADYLEPAWTIRLEADFPSDNRSQLGMGLELGTSMRIYFNLDDRGNRQNGIFWSEEVVGTSYTASITEKPFDITVLGRPSVRYVTVLGNNFKVGLSGGFGIGLNFGSSTTETETWASKQDYIDGKPSTSPKVTSTSTPALDLGLYPNLGVGFSFMVMPALTLNGGAGATQTLYRIRTGETETGGKKTTIMEQSWGKPLGQLALGATFLFKESFTLDALFSTNGTSFDNANFVVQFSAVF